jgi:hypothetical protein
MSGLCEDCGEEGGNHGADCPFWGDPDAIDQREMEVAVHRHDIWADEAS